MVSKKLISLLILSIPTREGQRQRRACTALEGRGEEGRGIMQKDYDTVYLPMFLLGPTLKASSVKIRSNSFLPACTLIAVSPSIIKCLARKNYSNVILNT